MAKHDVRDKQGRYATAPVTAPTAAPGKPDAIQASDVVPSFARLGTTALVTTVGGLMVMLGGAGAAVAAPQRMDTTNTVVAASTEKCNAAQRKAKKAQKRAEKVKRLNKKGKATSKKVKKSEAHAQKRARQAVKACAVTEARVTDPLAAAKAEYKRTVKAEPEVSRAASLPGSKVTPWDLDYADAIVTEVSNPLPGLVIERGTGVDTGTRYMSIFSVNPACDCVMGAGLSDVDRANAGAGPLDDITQFRINGTDRGYPIYEAYDPTPGIEEWVRIA